MFTNHISLLWKIIRRVFYIIGGFFLFIVVIEMIRALQTLNQLHPILAWSVGFLFLGSIIWGIWKVMRLFKEFPTAQEAPDPKLLGGRRSKTFLKAQMYYLKTVVNDLTENSNLSQEIRSDLKKIESENDAFSFAGEQVDITQRIIRIDSKIITPALLELDKQAEIIVRNTVRDTMVGVMLLPFKAADMYLVIYRNGSMFFDLVKLYNHKPGPIQTYHIFKDILKIVATVNILNYAEQFTQKVMGSVPFLNKTIDDIMQGIGGGLLTTAVGKATIQRCRAYSTWDQDEQIESYRKTTVNFLVYVKDIFSEDVLPNMSSPWKVAWGQLKGFFEKSDLISNEKFGSDTYLGKINSLKGKIQFWKKDMTEEIET